MRSTPCRSDGDGELLTVGLENTGGRGALVGYRERERERKGSSYSERLNAALSYLFVPGTILLRFAQITLFPFDGSMPTAFKTTALQF